MSAITYLRSAVGVNSCDDTWTWVLFVPVCSGGHVSWIQLAVGVCYFVPFLETFVVCLDFCYLG